jgi:D-alanine-D-alanine ligase
MNIKVIFSSGGKYNKNPEQKIADDETVDIANKISEALKEAGHSAETVKVTPSQVNRVKKLETDVVFNLCEWSGRDYHLGTEVLKILEDYKIPHTGADSKSYDWCSNKVVMKRMFDERNIPTPNWTDVTPADNESLIGEKIQKLAFPIIVKPAYEHCAIGIDDKSVITSKKSALSKIQSLLETYQQPIIVEEYIEGREFTLTVIKNHVLHIFPAAEVIFPTQSALNRVLSFETKWSENGEYDSVLLKDKKLAKQLERVAKDTFLKMNCCGYVRIDTRYRNGKVYVLEINVNPDIYPEEGYGLTVSTEAGGWNFTKLVDEIACAALDSPQLS